MSSNKTSQRDVEDLDTQDEPQDDTESDGGSEPRARKKRSSKKAKAETSASEDDDDESDSDEEQQPELDAEGEPLEGELVGEFEDDAALAATPAALAKIVETGVSSLDPLQAYIRDIQRFALLTPEETHDLSVKYIKTGDVDAAKKLVTANLRLVVKIAFDYRRAHRNILDLVQEGNIGLMQAVKKYDPYRGVKLSSYAAWWIRAYMLRFVLNNWRLVKLGTTQAQRKLFFNLRKEKARLSAMGIEPTADLIAQNLNVSEDDVVQMDQRLSGGDVSLDAPVSNAEGRTTSRIEMMAGDDGDTGDRLADGEAFQVISSKLQEFGKTLTGKEQVIFHERLLSDDPKTLQELGDVFGVSRERVRQLEQRLQGKIKVFLEKQVDPSLLPDRT